MPGAKGRVCVTLAVFALVVGCSGAPAGTPAPTPASGPPSIATTTPPLPPLPGNGEAKPAKPPPSVAGTCGTVTAASGLVLQVLGGQAGGVDCAVGRKIVAQFQLKIAGKQPAESNEPVRDTVDGWLCVSGPPAAQGGTTCSKDNQTVLAAVVPSE